jgi:hypothetical protein
MPSSSVLEEPERQSPMLHSFLKHLFVGAIALGLFCGAAGRARNLSPLGKAPDWSALQQYQETMTRETFLRLLAVYCPRHSSADVIKLEGNTARILESKEGDKYFVLRFARSEAARRESAPAWATLKSLPSHHAAGPLAHLHIALDPGHLGGTWARMEERWFQVDDALPVEEGDLTLHVAQMIAPRLQELGAIVSLVRNKPEPVTPKRPDDFQALARQLLKQEGVTKPRRDFDGPADPEKEKTIAWQSEILFYRNSEIRHRARRVNERLRPDLVLCLHFNAEAWGDPADPILVDKDHLHLLVNGCYLPAELDFDDERFEMIRRLLSGAYFEEAPVAEALAASFAQKTQLPPYEYTTPNAIPIGTSGYVYARNLLATRLYRCPTVYLEPYVMNGREAYARIEAGDYDGEREIAGKQEPSIFREYAESVVQGLVSYYKSRSL